KRCGGISADPRANSAIEKVAATIAFSRDSGYASTDDGRLTLALSPADLAIRAAHRVKHQQSFRCSASFPSPYRCELHGCSSALSATELRRGREQSHLHISAAGHAWQTVRT